MTALWIEKSVATKRLMGRRSVRWNGVIPAARKPMRVRRSEMLIYRREHSRHGRLGEKKEHCVVITQALSAKGEYGSAIRATTSTITNQGNRTIESSIAIFSKYPLLCFQVAASPR